MTIKYILIVEDEEKIAGVVRDYLERSGFKTHIITQGDKAVPHVREKAPDLVLLDIMLPNMDGIEVCKEIRKFSQLPIIMMTARVEEIDRLIGFELGADDYICKPFSPRELVARVKAVLKRSGSDPAAHGITFGPIRVNESTRVVMIEDHEIKLTPNEYGLLIAILAMCSAETNCSIRSRDISMTDMTEPSTPISRTSEKKYPWRFPIMTSSVRFTVWATG
jgi:two-component system response regulator BaeR